MKEGCGGETKQQLEIRGAKKIELLISLTWEVIFPAKTH